MRPFIEYAVAFARHKELTGFDYEISREKGSDIVQAVPVGGAPELSQDDVEKIYQDGIVFKTWADIRRERNGLLRDCDYTQVPDAPVDQEAWKAYRQALRDITSQPDPFNIEWPVAPDQGA